MAINMASNMASKRASNERYRKMISGYRTKFMDTTPVAQWLRDHLVAVCIAYRGPGSSG